MLKSNYVSGDTITSAYLNEVSTKLNSFVSVKDFGAVGDGVTDDTYSIQAALNASRNVYIPSGTYLFSSLNINYRNTILRGASARTAILKHTGSGAAITCSDSSSSDPDGRGVYIDSGWFIFEDFELMVNGSFGIRVGKTRSTFTQFNRLYIRHRRDIEVGDLNNQYFAGSVAIDCDNTPWLSSYSTYLSKIHHCFIRGFETAVNLQSTVNGFEVNRLYTIECKKQIVLSTVTGISVIDTYFESGVAGAIGFTFLGGGGNNVNIIGTTFELTNAAATQYAYAFSGGTWDGITVIGSKYLLQGDGNSLNNRRTTGTVPTTFLEINRSYTSDTYGTIPMMWCPSTSDTAPFQQPNYSRFGGYLQGNGHIKLGRGDTDASDHNIYYSGANTLVFDANDGGFNFNAKGVASRFVIEPYSAVVRPGADNVQTLGSSTYRWSTIYAATGTINTSDARSKQDDRPLSEKERAVAAKAKELLKAFRFKDSVADKGDEARIHFGVYAQELMEAFEAEGLDPENYAMFCHDKWDAAPEQIDADGNVISPAIEAGDRYGIRYYQLLAFIIAAM